MYIKDSASSIVFTEVTLTLENYARLITGLAEVECTHSTLISDHIGKKRIREVRKKTCPNLGHNRKAYVDWLEENAQEDGFVLDTYLGGQDSVKYKGNTVELTYCVHKFVDPVEEPNV